ncbi:MAG: NmrA family NAD(P)-binding protein [Nitrospirae bacterium]|nr:NmrA family NAD(P)-binding protein [Nitrospirota bacterium]
MFVITGATGNIGSKLVDDLHSRGHKVRAVGRSKDRLQRFIDKGAEAAAGDLADSGFLAKAFSNADAVFAMIPPNYAVKDFRAYQNEIGASTAEAIRKSGVKHVVNLSSQGANLPDRTGPIKGLHDQEERLNKLDNVNVLHVRPTYFMENLLMYVPMIKNMDMAGSAVSGGVKFAMIATKDIAKFIAERLVKRDFSGKSVRDILGQRDVSMNEAIQIFGKKINKPGLKYVQFSYEDAEKGLIGAGLSEDLSRLYVEMSRALNEGLFAVNLTRTPENTTETSIEEFADVFAKIYLSG